MALYANDHVKNYDGADPLLATVPPEISKILLNKFEDFLAEDFTTIMKFDNFEIPDGILLYDTQDEWKNYSQKDDFQDENNYLDEENPNIEPKRGEIEDKFSPEMPEGNDNSQVLHTKWTYPLAPSLKRTSRICKKMRTVRWMKRTPKRLWMIHRRRRMNL
jgi:hypothetical protein